MFETHEQAAHVRGLQRAFCVSKCKYNSEDDTSMCSRHVRGFVGEGGFARTVVVVSLTHWVGPGPFSPQLVVQMRV